MFAARQILKPVHVEPHEPGEQDACNQRNPYHMHQGMSVPSDLSLEIREEAGHGYQAS